MAPAAAGAPVAVLLMTLAACAPQQNAPDPAAFSIGDFLGAAPPEGFARAERPVPLLFPADHGAHPDFRNEWWYLTGNLAAEGGRRFGFQFTLFRNALSPKSVEHPSKWATRQAYLAHLALSDVEGDRFRADERFARGALGLAGVENEPFRAWLEDWRLVAAATPGCAHCFAVELRAETEDFGVALRLDSARSPVLHGDAGLSRKGGAEGNASYYYSFTRLETSGELRIDNRRYAVRGTSWMDHEWSTSSLQEDQVGWDWFSLQLSDGSDLMVFQLRHRFDADRNYRYATFAPPGGEVVTLGGADVEIAPTGSWTSPDSGAAYPSGWTIDIAPLSLAVALEPLMKGQEMNLSFRYWEGAVQASGKLNDRPVAGFGYAELTGY